MCGGECCRPNKIVCTTSLTPPPPPKEVCIHREPILGSNECIRRHRHISIDVNMYTGFLLVNGYKHIDHNQ